MREVLGVGCELVGLGYLQYRSGLPTTPFVHASTEVSGVLPSVMAILSRQNVALCESVMASIQWAVDESCGQWEVPVMELTTLLGDTPAVDLMLLGQFEVEEIYFSPVAGNCAISAVESQCLTSEVAEAAKSKSSSIY